MANVKLQHVNTFADRHGRLRSYLRLPGRKALVLPGQPGSPEFMAAYNAAITGAAPPPGASKVLPGSLDDLVVSWYASDHWTTLRGTTQAHYRRVIENLRKEHGDKPIRLMTPAGVRKLMEGRPATMANRVLRLIGLLLRHAIELGWRDDDPTRAISRRVSVSAVADVVFAFG
jgi:hypothetical protein